jgi:hypothetical protein
MKRLILDYFSRKIWILAIGAVLELLIGWRIGAGSRAFSGTDFGFQLQIALFIGVLPLLFDLSRGVARTVTSLPLTAAQIGRTWWLATVGILGISISALLFLGAGTFHLLHPHAAFPTGKLAMASIFTLLWLGAGFTTIFGIAGGFYGSLWERTYNAFFAILWGILCGFSLILFRDLTTNSIKAGILLGFGILMTTAGWFYAGRFVLRRASFRLAGRHSRKPWEQNSAPTGYGGLSLLISHTFIRGFLIGLGIIAVMILTMALDGHVKSWHQIGGRIALMGSTFPVWFIIVFSQTTPVLLQLRLLRTLPISATNLAAVIVATAILPLFALFIVMATFIDLTSATPSGVLSLTGFALTMAPTAICVFLIVWQGVGWRSQAFLILTMLGFQMACIFEARQIPLILAGAIVGISVTLAFLLTRRSIMVSSQTYRIQATPFGNSAWGAGR